ncbi:rhomboid family intramembrane serine protease [Terriglobus roseus]|uniref:Rhomboid protease GluP n=1 Tax=Terriglobus roseus TaxID=392734 RepID=A0A1G7M3N5_9BACT|nr:rhomboid family intramembrane serine protease [Terriglobus roseus]SDF56418.1 rhomboid protease GluP [Terriglobus roseus]
MSLESSPEFDAPRYGTPADDVQREDAALQSAAARRSVGSRLPRLRQAPATYLLLGINIAVYLWMILHGVNPISPDPDALVRFGATDAPKIFLEGQWFRVVSAMFVHVGLLHLATNMWCLWNLGVIGEPLLGFFGVCSVYLLTGISGNLLSLTFNGQGGVVGAGASGAVFGVAGILIVLFSNKKLAEPRPGFHGIPLQDLYAIRRSVISFAALNLLIGVGSMSGALMHSVHLDGLRIDNFAHIGGLLFGLLLGLPLVPRMTSGRQAYLSRQKVTFAGALLALALYGYFLSNLQ